jgi:predicted TPR repeat methyltransferase
MTPQEFREMAYSFETSRVILSSIELNIFSAIGDIEKTSEEISKEISTNERATDRLLNVLCSMDLLVKKEGKFANTDFTLKYLDNNSPEFMSGLIHTINLWDSWNTLTDAVRKGESVRTKIYEDHKEDWVENLIEAMHYRAKKKAPSDILSLDLSNVTSVLDLGGGSGVYSMAFVKAKEDINATVFDLPNVILLTKKYIQKANLSDKINTREGNYLTDSIGKKYDLIFLSAIIHSNSFEENKKLIKKCSMALNSKGQIVIQDFVMSEERTSPAHGAFFSLNMLVNTKAGDTYTESEIRSWLTDCGISNIIRKETAHGVTQIIGRKNK